MNIIKTVVFSLLFSMPVLMGCQQKVTRAEPPPAKPKTVEIAPQIPVPAAPDTGAFNEAKLQGELLRQAQEALKNIYFNFDESSILPESEAQLTIIGKFMLKHPAIRILITGNCDERGSDEYNIGLGERRANVAKDFLAAYGISKDRLETTSYGKERLAIEGCTDEACHAKNRRDEFTVLQSNDQPLSDRE